MCAVCAGHPTHGAPAACLYAVDLGRVQVGGASSHEHVSGAAEHGQRHSLDRIHDGHALPVGLPEPQHLALHVSERTLVSLPL